jgi:hypothetical protein
MLTARNIYIAAMLAADAELDVRARLAPALGGDGDEFADAFLIERDEGIARDQSARDILAEERRRIVA